MNYRSTLGNFRVLDSDLLWNHEVTFGVSIVRIFKAKPTLGATLGMSKRMQAFDLYFFMPFNCIQGNVIFYRFVCD